MKSSPPFYLPDDHEAFDAYRAALAERKDRNRRDTEMDAAREAARRRQEEADRRLNILVWFVMMPAGVIGSWWLGVVIARWAVEAALNWGVW